MKPKQIYFKDVLHLVYPKEAFELPYFALRMTCPCAMCVDEITGQRKIDRKDIDPKVHPIDCEYVGNYGIKIKWSDDHSTGIYPFDYLRAVALDLTKTPFSEDCKHHHHGGPHHDHHH